VSIATPATFAAARIAARRSPSELRRDVDGGCAARGNRTR